MSRSPFKWNAEWSGIILSDDNLLLPNTWTMSFEYDAVSDNMLHRDIAMQRLDFMVNQKFNTSTWTNFSNAWVSEFYNKMDAFIITLPSDPYDSLIAATAMLKAQSMTKGVLDIQACSIVSRLGYNVENIIEYDEAERMAVDIDHKYFSDGPWFMREDVSFTDLLVFDDDKPTLIKDSAEWDKFELDWDYYDHKNNSLTPTDSFIHNNQQERWIPLVIKGGNNKKDNDED